jgi:hypothetical protein
MKYHLTPTFWIETILAAASALLLVLTLIWPDWIEIIFGVDLDYRSGSLEWLLALACLGITIAFAALARHEWRRAVRSQ